MHKFSKYKNTDENGEFVPSPEYSLKEDGRYTVGYLEELCEWVYNNDELDDETRLKQILLLESIIKSMVKSIVKGCNYIPTWSKKLTEKLEKI